MNAKPSLIPELVEPIYMESMGLHIVVVRPRNAERFAILTVARDKDHSVDDSPLPVPCWQTPRDAEFVGYALDVARMLWCDGAAACKLVTLALGQGCSDLCQSIDQMMRYNNEHDGGDR